MYFSHCYYHVLHAQWNDKDWRVYSDFESHWRLGLARESRCIHGGSSRLFLFTEHLFFWVSINHSFSQRLLRVSYLLTAPANDAHWLTHQLLTKHIPRGGRCPVRPSEFSRNTGQSAGHGELCACLPNSLRLLGFVLVRYFLSLECSFPVSLLHTPQHSAWISLSLGSLLR